MAYLHKKQKLIEEEKLPESQELTEIVDTESSLSTFNLEDTEKSEEQKQLIK